MRGAVIDTLLEIPSHVRGRLASALESGLLAPPWTAMAIRATVGGGCEESVFVTSANLTAAAWDRNIELGLLVRDRALATTTVIHFRTLIEKDLLRRLPGT